MASEDSGDGLRSFLLIVRTGWIVTALIRASTTGYSGFPAYSRLLISQSPVSGAAASCLREALPTLGPL